MEQTKTLKNVRICYNNGTFDDFLNCQIIENDLNYIIINTGDINLEIRIYLNCVQKIIIKY